MQSFSGLKILIRNRPADDTSAGTGEKVGTNFRSYFAKQPNDFTPNGRTKSRQTTECHTFFLENQ